MNNKVWLDCYTQRSGSLLEVVIIGMGGVGCIVAAHISRILSFTPPFTEIKVIRVLFIDGDSFEFRNAERQRFHRLGKKAEVQAELLSKEYPRIFYGFIPRFVGENSSEREVPVESVVRENRIVFLAPDNGKTRKIVNDACTNLKNSVLICGGNDVADGYGHLFVRREGKDATLPITYHNPAVSEPKDKSPADMGCAELMEIKPQLYLANLDVATTMIILFYSLVTTPMDKGLPFFRVFCDSSTGKRRVIVNDQTLNP